MRIISILPPKLKKVKPTLITFIRRHGDQRITHHAIRWFSKLRSENLNEGTCVTVVLSKKKLAGIVVFGNYGLDEAFTAVHPDYRKKGVGEMLLKHSLEKLDRVYTRVATDNIPSLKLCFSCGLIAFHLIRGPTDKPTLVLGGGNWMETEFHNRQQKNQGQEIPSLIDSTYNLT